MSSIFLAKYQAKSTEWQKNTHFKAFKTQELATKTEVSLQLKAKIEVYSIDVFAGHKGYSKNVPLCIKNNKKIVNLVTRLRNIKKLSNTKNQKFNKFTRGNPRNQRDNDVFINDFSFKR